MHKESIIKNLDMIIDHMQYKQPNEFGETHREESGISESSRPYENIYEPARISTKLNYTEQRVNPDHPHLTRQGGRTPNSYNEEETNTQLNKEHLKELTFTPACSTKHAAQESSGSLNSHNYWEILGGEDTEEELEHLGGLCDFNSRSSEENCNFNMIQPLKSRNHGHKDSSDRLF